MKTIFITIGASSNHFGAYSENCPGIYGAGDTAEEAKQNALKGMELFISSRDKNDLPDILQQEFNIVYKYDTQSLLNYYNKIFSNVVLERLTGINQKLLHHYSSGSKKPRYIQRKKIENALHNLGKELLAVEL